MLIVYHVNLVRAMSCEFVFSLKTSAFLIIAIDWFDLLGGKLFRLGSILAMGNV